VGRSFSGTSHSTQTDSNCQAQPARLRIHLDHWLSCCLLLSLHGSYGQGKSGKVRKNPDGQGKSGNSKVPWCKSWQRCRKKQNCCTHTAYSSSKFFLLASLADYLYFYFFICSAALVSSVIASDWKPTLVFRMNKLVRENNSFCSGKSGESQGKCILQSSRNHVIIYSFVW